MRCQIQLANLGLRQAKLADRIVPKSDYIPEVYFTKGASDAASQKRGVRIDKEYLQQIKDAEVAQATNG